MSDRVRGKCWSCGLWVWLRKDGTLGSHRVRGGHRHVCEGSGRTPGESGLG